MLVSLLILNGLAIFSVSTQIGSQGRITGFVRDQNNAVLSGSTVVVTDSGTGQKRTVQADSDGYYVVANIPPGVYEVNVEQQGFKRFVQTVKLDAASSLNIDVTLEIGDVGETVTVTESGNQIQTTTAQVGRLLEGEQIQRLSLNGRNPILLGTLKAGVVGSSSNADTNGFVYAPTTAGLSVNGSRPDETNILLDGVQQVRTRSAGTTTGVVGVDTVQEVQILTSSYAAEFGRTNGGQFLFVTKPGTQEFHGTLSYFLRNDAFDANTWSRNRTPVTPELDVASKPQALRFNQPGYSIGGPIFIPGKFNTNKDKLFFFFAQEYTRFRREDTSTATVPSVALRSGDLRELGTGRDGQFGTADDPAIDPLTGVGFVDPARGPGFIPASRLSENGSALVNAYPLPNCTPIPGSTGCFPGENTNWIGTGKFIENTRKDVLRLDYYSGIHHLSFRGSLFAWEVTNAFRGNFNFAPDLFDRPNRSAGITLTSTLSPTLINEATFGASADIVRITPGGTPSREALGINYPYIFPGTKELDDKIPTVAVSNFSTIDGGPYPGSSSGPIYTWTDALTYVHGAHTIKGGINIEYSGQNDFDQVNVQSVPGSTNNQNGQFVFSNDRVGGTGVGVVNALLGLTSTYAEIGQKSYTPWRATAVEFFIQDNWKVNPKLTVEYGFRWNFWPPWHSTLNNIASFEPDLYQPGLLSINTSRTSTLPLGAVIVTGSDFTLSRFNGISIAGDGFPPAADGRVAAAADPEFDKLFQGVPRGLSQTHNNLIEPRLGIAYAFNDKTVIRTGFGIFHQRVLLNDSSLLGGNAPLQLQVLTTNGDADAPGGTITSTADSIRFPFSLTAQDPVFDLPTTYNWSLTVQRELPGRFLLELGYVGKRSNYLPRERNINSLQPGENFVRDEEGNVIGTQPVPDALRPFLGHGPIRLSENAASAIYHSFQTTLSRRFNNGFSLDIAYTFSKSLDNASDKRDLLPNAFDDANYRALSNFDRPHVFVVNYIYELPIGSGKRFLNRDGITNAVLGGWQLTGTSSFRSGSLFSITTPIDVLGVGPGAGAQFVTSTGQIVQISDPQLGESYFNDPTLFTLPEPGTEGTLGRNYFRDPAYQSNDLALVKNFHVSENVRLEFRTEMFNFLNHPLLGRPNTNINDNNAIVTDVTSPNFGQFRPLTEADINNGFTSTTRNFGVITGKTNDRRTIQFGLKVIF